MGVTDLADDTAIGSRSTGSLSRPAVQWPTGAPIGTPGGQSLWGGLTSIHSSTILSAAMR